MEDSWFQWAKEYPDLEKTLNTFGYYELDKPLRYKYREIKRILQQGPQCGLVALAMCSDRCSPQLVADIFKFAKDLKYTNNGEIFSVDYMHHLSTEFLNGHSEIFNGSLLDDTIIEFLFEGGLLLVPYDSDKNKQPCLRDGQNAHWAVIFGAVQTENSTYVLARHGTSSHPAVWSLKSLAESNSQLNTFSQDRAQSFVKYVLPEGGMSGPRGLCNRTLLIYPNDHKENSERS